MSSIVVFIARVIGSARTSGPFAELEAFSSDSVARLAERACTKFPLWGVDASQIELFLIAAAGRAPLPAEVAAALRTPLSPFDALAVAGVAAGSCLLALVSAPTAAAVLPGSREAFKALLRAGGVAPRDEVLERLQAARDTVFLTAATPAEARRWYDWAKLLPLSPTRGVLEGETGIFLDSEHPFHHALLLAFDAEGRPLAFKPLPAATDPEATAALAACGGPCIAPCSLARARHSDGSDFVGLVMPKYDHSLADVADHVLSPAVIFARARGLVAAVSHLHTRGLVHMDIKEANVFVDGAGVWWLGDFGSAVEVGTPITSTTRGLHPDLVGWSPAVPARAAWAHDWFMLAALLARRLDAPAAHGDYLMRGPQRADIAARAARCGHGGLGGLIAAALGCDTSELALPEP